MREDRPDPEEAEGTAPGDDREQTDRGDVPPDVVDEAERLTRLAREAVDDREAGAYRERRASLVAEYDYTVRVREDDSRDVLVLYPAEWVEDGVVQMDRVEDLDRGVERPLSGPGEPDEWQAVDDHNRELVAAVREAHGAVHAANVDALADFMGNHYAKPIERATRAELEEFLEEYYPRNAFATDEQAAVVEKSVFCVFEAAGKSCPLTRSG
jgi:hypothetical protein